MDCGAAKVENGEMGQKLYGKQLWSYRSGCKVDDSTVAMIYGICYVPYSIQQGQDRTVSAPFLE